MRHREHLERWVPDLRERRILDLGCGRGDILMDFVRHGYTAVGLDKNPAYLDTAKDEARRERFALDVREGEAEAMPFPDASFDFINCNEVTEHVESPEKLLKECSRVLTPGGKMYVSFHNRFGIYDYHYHLWGINWLPRKLADWIIEMFGRGKGNDERAGRQKLSRMQYVGYRDAIRLLEKANFDWLDIRKAQLEKPELARRRIVRLIHRFGLAPVAFWLIKHFVSTFHFIVTKI